MDNHQVHFDCTKNKLPSNWTNGNATAYYNRAFWKRCKCEYGTDNPCKKTADKWNTVATEPSRWTKGCSPCSSYYDKPSSYFYTYNVDKCGETSRCKCIDKDKCNCDYKHHGHDDHGHGHDDHGHGHDDHGYDNHRRGDEHIHRCDDHCHKSCERNHCRSRCGNRCDGHRCDEHCHRSCEPNNCRSHCGSQCHLEKKCDERLKAYIYDDNCCGGCKDVEIVYKMINNTLDCHNIVELRLPPGGSKEVYMAKNFSPEFVYANRFQCATVPTYYHMPNNVIDNRKQEDFTPSDQSALTKRGIHNALTAQRLVEEGKLIDNRFAFQIPMNVIGRSCYYYLGDGITNGSLRTGLAKEDIVKGYFGSF